MFPTLSAASIVLVGKVRISRRGPVPPMPEELAAKGKILARHHGLAGYGMAKVPPTSTPTIYRARGVIHNYMILFTFLRIMTADFQASMPSPSAYRKRICSSLCALQRGSVPKILQHRSTGTRLYHAPSVRKKISHLGPTGAHSLPSTVRVDIATDPNTALPSDRRPAPQTIRQLLSGSWALEVFSQHLLECRYVQHRIPPIDASAWRSPIPGSAAASAPIPPARHTSSATYRTSRRRCRTSDTTPPPLAPPGAPSVYRLPHWPAL